jgi:glycosyltransferase involved in cell wall biosynthesis
MLALIEPQFIFISHPIDNTGAPSVLLQIVEEYASKYGPDRVRLIAPGITKAQENHLKSLGITIEKAVHAANLHFIRLQLGLRQDDFILMNTVAIYDNYRDFVLLWLRLGRLNHAYWFIHEDIAQIPIINAGFSRTQNIQGIRGLINGKKLSMLYPSKRTSQEYKDKYSFTGRVVDLRVDVPTIYTKRRSADDFDEINILLSGTSSDGRKGQILALSAMQHFLGEYYKLNPSIYRRVHLNLLAVGANDYISKQIRWIASSVLKDYVSIDESMPKNDALKLAHKSNVVLCCSLNETFGLYIAEGMLMGHILIRNNSAGVDEQLIDGQNGILIDHTDIKDVSRAIEYLANKKTTNRQLSKMSTKSQQIMKTYTDSSYITQISEG